MNCRSVNIVCTPRYFQSGGARIVGFWGGQNIFNFRGLVLRGEGYISLEEVSSFYIHFPILKCKISKIRKVQGPSFSVFTFSNLRWVQVFKQILTLTLNLNFLEQFLFTFQWALKTNQIHEITFFFIHLVRLRDLQIIQSVKPEHFV